MHHNSLNNLQSSSKSKSGGVGESSENNKSSKSKSALIADKLIGSSLTKLSLGDSSVIDKNFKTEAENTSDSKPTCNVICSDNKSISIEEEEEDNDAFIKSIEQLLRAIEKAPYLTKGLKEILSVDNLNISNKHEPDTNESKPNSIYQTSECLKHANQCNLSLIDKPPLSVSEPNIDKKKANHSPSDYSIITTNGSELTPNTDSSKTDTHSKREAKIDVYVVLAPENKVIHKNIPLATSIKDIANEISEILDIPVPVMDVSIDKEKIAVKPNVTFESLGFAGGNIVSVQVMSRDPDRFPIATCFLGEKLKIIPATVTPYTYQSGKTRLLVTEIFRNPDFKKPFLGGFRHKETNRIYHNASSQTPRPSRKIICSVNSRDTQTYELSHALIQTRNNTSTQMTKPYCYVSNLTDKLLTPGRYETADEREKKILKQIIILQKHWRAWLAKRRTHRIRTIKRLVEMTNEEIIEHKKKVREALMKKYKQKRIHPKSIKDFDLLYSDLEKWRLKQLEQIDNNFTGAERKAALSQLLDEECEFILAIDRQKRVVFADAKNKSYYKLLEKGAKVKEWKSEDNALHRIDTMDTQRCRLLLHIYESLNMRYLSDQHRLDILLSTKKIVEEHDCPLTRDLIDLLQREGLMIMRNINDRVLEGLRQRISTLFHIYAKTPEFNPEIAQYLKYPINDLAFRGKNFKCRSCKKYLLSEEFPLSIVKFNMNYCRACVRLKNIGCKREDFSPYSYLLDQLRRNEIQQENGIFSMAFLMNRDDAKYLVEDIWNKCSILSGWTELFDLKLTRWNVEQDWSPWNNILLTKDEADAHESLANPYEVYAPELISTILQKHSVAKIYYARLIVQSNLLKVKYERDLVAPFKREYIMKPKSHA